MRFENPAILSLLLLTPLLGLLAWAVVIRRRRRLRAFISPELLPRLVVGTSRGRSIVLTCLRICAIGFFVIALARPQWGRKDEPIVRRGVDVALALDLSTSMLAEDVSPNRLEEAKSEAVSLLRSLTGDRVALVVFGGRATVQCPLTLDYGAVRLFLDAAEPDVSPGPGSDIGRAIEESMKLFNSTERRYKTIVLLTDGEDLEGGGLDAAKKAAAEGVLIHAIGVGTQGGGPIPLRDDTGTITGYKKDREGRVVTSRFDPTSLEKVAAATAGTFLAAGPVGEEGRRIAEVIAQMEKKEISSRIATRFEDRFQLPLALGLIFLVIEAAWVGRRALAGAGSEIPFEEAALADLERGGASTPAVPASEGGGRPAGIVTAACLLGLWLGAASIRDAAAEPGTGAPAPGAAAPAGGSGNGEGGTSSGSSESALAAQASQDGGKVKGANAPAASPVREEKAASAAVARGNRDANRLYGQKEYADALARYEQASAAAPELPSLRYNIGNALYRQGKYDEAASEYTRSLSRAGQSLAPAARYNLGNAQYQQKHYDEAAEAYLKVLKENPQDESARKNLELALRMLKQAKQQPQPSKGSPKDDKKDQQQQGQPQQNEDQQQKGQPQQNKDQQQSQDQEAEEQQAAQQKDQDQKSSQKGQTPRSGDGKLDRKDAERLLDSLAQEEKQDLKKRLARMPREQGPEKDW